MGTLGFVHATRLAAVKSMQYDPIANLVMNRLLANDAQNEKENEVVS
jgi:hypothetical protein